MNEKYEWYDKEYYEEKVYEMELEEYLLNKKEEQELSFEEREEIQRENE